MNGGQVALRYDGLGQLVAKTSGGVTTQYLVDDLSPTGYPVAQGTEWPGIGQGREAARP